MFDTFAFQKGTIVNIIKSYLMKGLVYILTNSAMPGLVKIGLTTRSDIKQRIQELFTTGVPLPFECEFACEVENCMEVEKALHLAFSPNRILPNREFFKLEPEQPMAILKLFQKKETTEEVTQLLEEGSTPLDREAAEKLKRQRRPPLDFHLMGIPNGSVLVFLDDVEKNISAVVCSNKRVLYQGKEKSLSQLTSELLNIDYSVGPTPRWSYQGRSLLDIYNEVFSE